MTQTTSGAPASLMGKTVYVVDSHSLIYQVFHAMPEMTSPTGLPVGAIHGFIRDILDLLENKKPDYLFCAFDAPGNFRYELYDQYKIHREEMPTDLQPQIPQIRRMLSALGVPILACPNYEADDILATLAKQTEELGGECVLVTGDKDCRQLISDLVKIYNIRKNEFFDAAALQETWGIRPDQVVDFQALVGDSTDNIPGVALIGPKVAQELLAKYDTLEKVLDHAHELSGTKRRENLMNGRAIAMTSRELARLRIDTPIDIDWEAGRVGGVDQDQVTALCTEFGFRRLAERLGTLTIKDAPAAWHATYHTVATRDALADLVQKLNAQLRIAFDTETTSERPRWADLVGLSFAWNEGEAYYIPVRAPAGEPQLPVQEVLDALRGVLENPAIAKVGQNLKYDLIVLRSAGVDVKGISFDTMVADYLIDPGERLHNLDDLAKRFLNHDNISIEQLIGSGKKQKRMDEVPVAIITEYAAEDADVSLRLANILEKRLRVAELTDLFAKLEMPLVDVLVELEYNGIRVDVARLADMGQRFAAQLATLEEEIYEAAGEKFNIDSPSQLSKILFEKFKLPVIRKTKTGKSTDADVLAELAEQHPLPAKIVEYRQIAKLKGTYADALPELVNPKTNRVHSSFKQDVAATGRLSSTDPNLQNIPVRTEAGREIRAAFLPGEPGWLLMTADYSQIELRVLAHFSGDQTLREAFAKGEDIHTRVASEVYGVPLGAVTREQRRSAKAINFGVIYGQSAFGLSKSLDIPKDQAAEFINAYFARYPGVDQFMAKVLEDARKNGYVSTILGRRRAIQGVRPTSQRGDSRQRNLPERIAINTVIQGSAADLIKQAMIQVHHRLKPEKLQARMLLQIHDELVFEVPPDEISPLAALVTQEMSGVGPLDVPLQVDVKTGANWAECEPLS